MTLTSASHKWIPDAERETRAFGAFTKLVRLLSSRRVARGIREFKRGNHLAASRHFRAAARAGDPDGCYQLGQLYASAQGVLYNPGDAVYWYRKAAQRGQPDAQFELSLIYLYGRGGWYSDWFKAADAHDPVIAKQNRDALFPHGIDVPQDYASALKWASAAAAQGCVEAQANVGLLYLQGLGCETDHREAFRWLSMAAKSGSVEAQHGLGTMYAGGHGVKRDLVEAKKWYETAAAQNGHAAQFALGTLYMTGQGTERDIVRAAQLFQKASDQGNVLALHQLGLLYLHGEGVGRDLVTAESCFRRAARRGHVPAMISLAWLLGREEREEGRSPEDAALWYRSAADLGNPEAQFQLGVLHSTGDGVPRDVPAAAHWFRLAADKNHRIRATQPRRDALERQRRR